MALPFIRIEKPVWPFRLNKCPPPTGLLSRPWPFTDIRCSRWTSLRALTFRGFCCNIWYNLSTWTSLFPPFQDFLPFLVFKSLLMSFWRKVPILKCPAARYHGSRQMFCSVAHEAKLILLSHHYCAHIVLTSIPPISPGYHNNLVTNVEKYHIICWQDKILLMVNNLFQEMYF